MRSPIPEITEAIGRGAVTTGFRTIEGRKTYVYATPLQQDDRTIGALAVFLDASPLAAAELGLWQLNAVRFFVLALGISLITFLVLRMTIMCPMSALAEWTKSLKVGKPVPPPSVPDAHLFGPLAQEVSGLARNLYRAQTAAEREAALRLAGESTWTEERLKQFVRFASMAARSSWSQTASRSATSCGRPGPRAGSGQRGGDGTGTGHAGVWRGVGGPRQR